jgi:type IV fimbrial biogenesis protein FimT
VLRQRHRQRGTTLVELLIGLAIIALLFALGAPGFGTWIQNTQIRTAAETIQSGLQLARGEAVRRNATVRFQLTSGVTAGCALSTTAGNWVVSQDDPTGACNSAASDTVAPRIIQVRPTAEGSPNAVVAAGQSTIIFNGLGRVTPVPAANIDIDISNPTGGACATSSVAGMRCLRIRISSGGQVRMCDPLLASTDPQGC